MLDAGTDLRYAQIAARHAVQHVRSRCADHGCVKNGWRSVGGVWSAACTARK
jgi:hypothetical protein